MLRASFAQGARRSRGDVVRIRGACEIVDDWVNALAGLQGDLNHSPIRGSSRLSSLSGVSCERASRPMDPAHHGRVHRDARTNLRLVHLDGIGPGVFADPVEQPPQRGDAPGADGEADVLVMGGAAGSAPCRQA
jgi:hypothetical protein